MKTILMLVGLLFVAVPAFAINDSVVSYCFTTATPQNCIQQFLAEERAYQQMVQREFQQNQLEQARIQANGMALFGAGNAMINGVNQGFRMMQQPYVNTPYFQHSK